MEPEERLEHIVRATACSMNATVSGWLPSSRLANLSNTRFTLELYYPNKLAQIHRDTLLHDITVHDNTRQPRLEARPSLFPFLKVMGEGSLESPSAARDTLFAA